MNDIEIFSFNSNEVRIVLIDDEPWFVVNDVCSVLGINSPETVIRRLDEDDLCQTQVMDSMGRAQSTNIVNEGD